MSTGINQFAPNSTVTDHTIEMFLGALCAVPRRSSRAHGHLQPEHLSQLGEQNYRTVLAATYDYFDTHGELPPVGVLSARVCNAAETTAIAYPAPVREPMLNDARELVEFIFDETRNPASSLRPTEAIDTLRMILLDRVVGEPLRHLVAHTNGPLNIPILTAQIEQAHTEYQRIETACLARPVPVLGAGLADYYQQLEHRRGGQLLGMRTGMQQLDDRLCGLHDFLLLSAAPGVGKSVMALQMAVGVCRHSVEGSNSGCALYLSMDMASTDMVDRLHCYLAGFDWKTWRLGSATLRGQGTGARLTDAHARLAEQARQRIATWQLDTRLAIVSRDHARGITAQQIAAMARGLKQQVDAEHCLVIIDYLQLLPVPEKVARQGDLEADKHRVEIAQRVLDASKDQFDRPQDTVLAISEARKPGTSGRTWGANVEDLMGSARLGYSADGVLLMRPMDEKELEERYASLGGEEKIREQLGHEGVSPLMITLAKGRDGMTRGSWPAEFHFQQSAISEGVPARPSLGLVRPQGRPVMSGAPRRPHVRVDDDLDTVEE